MGCEGYASCWRLPLVRRCLRAPLHTPAWPWTLPRQNTPPPAARTRADASPVPCMAAALPPAEPVMTRQGARNSQLAEAGLSLPPRSPGRCERGGGRTRVDSGVVREPPGSHGDSDAPARQCGRPSSASGSDSTRGEIPEGRDAGRRERMAARSAAGGVLCGGDGAAGPVGARAEAPANGMKGDVLIRPQTQQAASSSRAHDAGADAHDRMDSAGAGVASILIAPPSLATMASGKHQPASAMRRARERETRMEQTTSPLHGRRPDDPARPSAAQLAAAALQKSGALDPVQAGVGSRSVRSRSKGDGGGQAPAASASVPERLPATADLDARDAAAADW